jgi:DNA-binding IclR family transcriptional regulator
MIQVLERAMKIVETLGENPGKAYSLSEIASAVSLDKGTCSHILKTLASGGFIRQDSPRSGYKLGYKFYHITGHPVENEELTKIARKDVETLGRELNETALLAVVNSDKRIVLYSTVPERNLIVRTQRERNIYSVCAGRVIVANYTPSHLEKFIIRCGLPSEEEWPEIYHAAQPRQALANAFAQIKQDGYAILDDQHGLIGFAAPLFRDGHVVGSLGTYLPVSRMTDSGKILERLLYYSGEINRKLTLSEL